MPPKRLAGRSYQRRQIDCQGRRLSYDVLSTVVAVSPCLDSVGLTPSPAKSLKPYQTAPFEICGLRFANSSPSRRRPTISGPVCVSSNGVVGVLTSRITARFRSTCSKSEVRNEVYRLGLRLGRELPLVPGCFDIRVPAEADIFSAANALNRLQICDYAVPEVLEPSVRRLMPNDPRIQSAWQLSQVDAPTAWDHCRGAGIRVAIIDWGFDLAHKDIAPAVTLSALFLENGIQQKASYFGDPSLIPKDKHGTACAGIAIARAGNSRFACGVAFESEFVPIACSPVMTQQTLARAIGFALDPSKEDSEAAPNQGADVISISVALSSSDMSPHLSDVLDFAKTSGRAGRGTPIFFAISNSEESLTTDPIGNDPRILPVGMTKSTGFRGKCAFGANLKFMAPGDGVRSTLSDNGFGLVSGSSFAAPCAAGVAALVLSAKPDLGLASLIEILQRSCDKVGGVTYNASGHNSKYGFGKINAAKAVALALAQQ